MSIKLIPIKHDSLCHGYQWKIEDESTLAKQIGMIALGQSRHVLKILDAVGGAGIKTGDPAAKSAIAMLTIAEGADPWHRDGWMFQAMSWIAAHKATGGALIRAPQMILADKGFDGLQLKINSKTGLIDAVIIFEDKATENPRATIRDKVWPEFKLMEGGDRENVLTAEVIGLLETRHDLNPDSAIEKVIWEEARQYRVSITINENYSTASKRKRLFNNYDEMVMGNWGRRHADTVEIKDLRTWMQNMADKAIAFVNHGSVQNKKLNVLDTMDMMDVFKINLQPMKINEIDCIEIVVQIINVLQCKTKDFKKEFALLPNFKRLISQDFTLMDETKNRIVKQATINLANEIHAHCVRFGLFKDGYLQGAYYCQCGSDPVLIEQKNTKGEKNV